MKIYPFYEVIDHAQQKMNDGAIVYQQWNCAHCGVKQTMDTPDVFYTSGICVPCSQNCSMFLTVATLSQPSMY